VLLLDQDRGRWDQLLIRRGLAALERATELGRVPGPYALQAAIAACHAQAPTAGDTDWARIASLYQDLVRLTPSPVVELNRAVAVGMAYGPTAGLEVVDRLGSDRALDGYHLLPAVRGDLLSKLGRHNEARTEFERAASLTRNARERDLLLERAASAGQPFIARP
jgi:predicted RNA polymerase sigma factor